MTGIWFQLARGRAMVRNRAMRDARRIQAHIIRGTQHGTGRPFNHIDARILEAELKGAVRRAREAHRMWREYRALHAQWLADDAEIAARYPITR